MTDLKEPIYGYQWRCVPGCDFANHELRQRCRNCGTPRSLAAFIDYYRPAVFRVTDLIARLEATDPVTHSDICGCPGWFPPEYTTCRTAALLDDFPAILRALKVQQAAEAYVDNLGAEKEWIHHANLVRAVKGEQP